MKAFQPSTRAILGFILLCVVALSLASCAQRFTLTSPAEVSQLPVSRGINGGSYVVPTAWQYRGSYYDAHQFRYYYHTDNQLHRCEVIIPRRIAVLHFREVAFGSEPRWQWVTLRSCTPGFHFSLFQPPPPRHE